MTSERKKAANRRNAQKSTGPRTEEGKARVRLNALKHGLAAAKTRGNLSIAEVSVLVEEMVRSGERWEDAKVLAEGIVVSRGIHRFKAVIWNSVGKPDRGGYGERLAVALKKLASLDRYYRRAISKRRRLIRTFRRIDDIGDGLNDPYREG